VAISGDGGDELFCGYPRFLDVESRYPHRPWHGLMRNAIGAGALPAALLRRSLWGQELLHYRRVELGPWPGRKHMATYLTPAAAVAARPERTLTLWRQLIAELGGHMDTATLMRADLWTYLSENCLAKTDRASMAHSLEVRVPMLGRPVIDAVLGLPAELHTSGGLKSLLTEIARRSLPDAVWNRPKHGFSVPLARLFDGPWRAVCDDVFDDVNRIAPWLDQRAVRQAWRQRQHPRSRVSNRLLYTLAVLLLWARQTRLDL